MIQKSRSPNKNYEILRITMHFMGLKKYPLLNILSKTKVHVCMYTYIYMGDLQHFGPKKK